jgi:hypothetical protein
MDHQAIEIIELATFAERMKVAETTVWKWIRNGRLRPGRHFIQIDRVIRFAWGAELIYRLHEDCLSSPEIDENDPAGKENTSRHSVRNGQQPLNLNY